jgi:hypothetical protein
MRLTALFFSVVNFYESHPTQQAHVKAALLVLVGECVPSLYLSPLYYTLDIKLNVPSSKKKKNKVVFKVGHRWLTPVIK